MNVGIEEDDDEPFWNRMESVEEKIGKNL